MAVNLIKIFSPLLAIGADTQSQLDVDFHSPHVQSVVQPCVPGVPSQFMTAVPPSVTSQLTRSSSGQTPPFPSADTDTHAKAFSDTVVKISSFFAVKPDDGAHDSGYSSDEDNDDDHAKTSSSKTFCSENVSPLDVISHSVGVGAIALGQQHGTSMHSEDENEDESVEADDEEEMDDLEPIFPRVSSDLSYLPSFSPSDNDRNRSTTTLIASRSAVLRPSRLLSDFELSTELGRGGFGVVMSGTSRLDSRQYAVKIIPYTLPPGYSDPNDYVSELDCFREVRTMAQMRGHDNVVRYYSAWHEEITPDVFEIIRDLDCFSNANGAPMNFTRRSEKIPPAERSFLRMASESSSSLWNLGKEFLGFGGQQQRGLVMGNFNEFADEDIEEALGDFDVDVEWGGVDGIDGEDETDFPELIVASREASVQPPPAPTHVLVIQMEMCEGGTLRDYLDEREKLGGEIDKTECLGIFHQIVEGLHHIHEHNVLHRDIKPANIFVSEGDVKLGDFGLSVMQNGSQSSQYRSSEPNLWNVERTDPLPGRALSDGCAVVGLRNLTSGLGSPGYAAPEQLDDEKKYSRPADVYPLGLILFELLSSIDTGMERVKAFADLKIRGTPPEEFVTMHPREAQLISLCLQLDPSARPDTEHILGHPIFSEISMMDLSDVVSSSPRDGSMSPSSPRRRLVRRPSLGVTTNLQNTLRHKMIEIDILRSRISQLEAQLEKERREKLECKTASAC